MSANIVEALKALAAKLMSTTASEIQGNDKCAVIDYIVENYTPSAGGPGPQGPKGDKGDKGDPGVGLTGTAQAITSIADSSTATAQDVAEKVNEIIAQLKARGVST